MNHAGNKFKLKMDMDDFQTATLSSINQLQKYATNWLLKLRVLRRGSIIDFNNNKGPGQIWKVILADNEVRRSINTILLLQSY